MANKLANPLQTRRSWAWIWLAYTGFLFIDPLFEPSRNLWLGTLAVFAVFLAIFYRYVSSTDLGQPTPSWMIAATFALGLITFPWNQGASTFFVYTAAFLPFSIESTRRVLWLFLAECLVILAEGYIFNLQPIHSAFRIGWPNTFIAIFLVLVIGGGNILFAQQRRADCKLRAALEENLALASVAERERIARDLHDVLGHTLSVIVLKAELAGRLVPIDAQRAAAEIADVERTARTALAEVREAIGGYRARGLAAEIEAARLTFDAAGVQLVAETTPTDNASLSAQEETALALALREAVTNIVRHARATTCRLRFITESGRRRLVVEDDGQHAVAREGNGLRGMRERIESLGGHFSLERGIVENSGTRLIFELPTRGPVAS
jgi:two-component system sensor histidine kinase DesK